MPSSADLAAALLRTPSKKRLNSSTNINGRDGLMKTTTTTALLQTPSKKRLGSSTNNGRDGLMKTTTTTTTQQLYQQNNPMKGLPQRLKARLALGQKNNKKKMAACAVEKTENENDDADDDDDKATTPPQNSPTRISDFPDLPPMPPAASSSSSSLLLSSIMEEEDPSSSPSTSTDEEDDEIIMADDDDRPSSLVSTILFADDDLNDSDDSDDILEMEETQEAAALLQGPFSKKAFMLQTLSLAPLDEKDEVDNDNDKSEVVVQDAADIVAVADYDETAVVAPESSGRRRLLVCTPLAPHRRKPWRRLTRTSHLLFPLCEECDEGEEEEERQDTEVIKQGEEKKEEEEEEYNNEVIANAGCGLCDDSVEDDNDTEAKQETPSSSFSSMMTLSTIDYELLSSNGHFVKGSSNNNNKTAFVAIKPTRMERIQELVAQASAHCQIGNEDQAIPLLNKAYKMADGQVAKVKRTLHCNSSSSSSSSGDQNDEEKNENAEHNTSPLAHVHVKVRKFAAVRLQQDWHALSSVAVKIQTKLAHLYEITAADYDAAISCALQALSIAKKQRKKRSAAAVSAAVLADRKRNRHHDDKKPSSSSSSKHHNYQHGRRHRHNRRENQDGDIIDVATATTDHISPEARLDNAAQLRRSLSPPSSPSSSSSSSSSPLSSEHQSPPPSPSLPAQEEVSSASSPRSDDPIVSGVGDYRVTPKVKDTNKQEDVDPTAWQVDPPNDIDETIASLQRLVRRLQYAETTFEQRKNTMEKIVQRRADGVDCLDLAKTALLAEQDALGLRHSHIGDWYQLLANIDVRNARTHLLTAYDIHQEALGDAHPRVGHDLILLAKCFDTSDIDTALHYYDLAVNVFCRIPLYGGVHIVASILNDMAVLHLARHETAIALELFHHALDLYRHDRCGGDAEEDNANEDEKGGSHDETPLQSLETVQVHRNIAECHFVLKDFDAAIASFRTALAIQKRAALHYHHHNGHNNTSGNNTTNSINGQLEDSSLDDSDKSSRAAGSPANTNFKEFANDESIADTLRRLGKTYLAAQLYDEAHEVLQESAQLFRHALSNAETLTAAGLTGIAISTKQDELAATLYFIAQYHEATASYDPAIRLFNESMQLRLASDSQREEKRNMVHCAMCLTGLANVCYRRGHFLEAHQTYNKALFFCEAQNIPFENPLVRMIDGRRREAERRVAADAPDRLERLAKEERADGRLEQAIVTLGTAVSLRQRMLQTFCNGSADPNANECAELQRQGIVRLLDACREIFLQLGDVKKAERAQQEATALLAVSAKFQQQRRHQQQQQPMACTTNDNGSSNNKTNTKESKAERRPRGRQRQVAATKV